MRFRNHIKADKFCRIVFSKEKEVFKCSCLDSIRFQALSTRMQDKSKLNSAGAPQQPLCRQNGAKKTISACFK